MKTVLITGIGGYIGSNLAARLLKKTEKYKLIGIGQATKFPFLKKRFGDAVELIESQISDEERVADAARGVEVIVHTAAPVNEKFYKEYPEKARQATVMGTRVVTQAAEQEGAFLVHLSTQAVYSTYAERRMPLSEDDALMPDNAYGRLKMEAEKEAQRIPSLILRLTNVYGSGDAVPMHSNVAAVFIKMACRGEALTLHGEGTQGVDLIHIDDLTRFMEQCIALPQEAARVLNVSSGRATPVKEIASIVQEGAKDILGRHVAIQYVSTPEGKGWPSRWLTNDKIKKIAPWFPSVGLREGIRESLNACKGI